MTVESKETFLVTGNLNATDDGLITLGLEWTDGLCGPTSVSKVTV